MIKKIPRLSYGFLSQSVDPKNIKLPWAESGQDGLFQMNYTNEAAMLDNLQFWAKTNKGEYVWDSNFGLDASRFLFDPSIFAKDNIEQNAKQQLPKYFPTLKVSKLQVLTTEDRDDINENTIVFRLEGFIDTDKKRNIVFEETIGV